MIKLAQWDDGYVLETDARREDPLYYYIRAQDRGSAIGVEVAPLYKEQASSEVTIRVWPVHVQRECRLDPTDRCNMYARVVSFLLRRFTNWSRITLHSSCLPEFGGNGPISHAFVTAGFARSQASEGEETWERA